jgi:dienelactone hydrolase
MNTHPNAHTGGAAAVAVCGDTGSGMTTSARPTTRSRSPRVRAWKESRPELAVHVYAAGHGFNCDQRGSYHAESAKLARDRTVGSLSPRRLLLAAEVRR